MLETLGNDPQRKRLYAGNGVVPVLAIAHDARQSRHFSEPSAVALAFNFNRERHACNVRVRLRSRSTGPARAIDG